MAFQLSFESQHKYATREGNLNVRTILSTTAQQVHCVAAIDTGATVCLFQRELGEALDLDIETGPFIQLSTLTGTLRAYGHEVTLQTFDLVLHRVANDSLLRSDPRTAAESTRQNRLAAAG